jgi:UvrD/REP helicase N-terminal domain
VLGGAGTGKTLLTLEAARRLSAQGLRVLVRCFNQPLGIYLAGQLTGPSGVEALHFHGICSGWAKHAGIDSARRDGESERDYYEIRAPNLLTEAAERLGRRVDAVLIDEAQDFLSEWIDALELLLEDRNGVMFLFADENQSIYHRGFTAPGGFFTYRLKSNLRNTGAIHRLLVDYFGEQSISKAPAGVAVTVRTWGTDKDLRKDLSRLLSSFRDNGIAPEWITVLTGRGAQSSRFAEGDGHSALFGCAPTRRRRAIFASHRFAGSRASSRRWSSSAKWTSSIRPHCAVSGTRDSPGLGRPLCCSSEIPTDPSPRSPRRRSWQQSSPRRYLRPNPTRLEPRVRTPSRPLLQRAGYQSPLARRDLR